MYIETNLPLETNNLGEQEVIIVAEIEFAQSASTDKYGLADEMGTSEEVHIEYVKFAGIEWEDLKLLHEAFKYNYDFDLFKETIEEAAIEQAHEDIKKEYYEYNCMPEVSR